MKSHKICNFSTGPPFTVQKSYFNTVNILISFKSTMNKLLTWTFLPLFLIKNSNWPSTLSLLTSRKPFRAGGFFVGGRINTWVISWWVCVSRHMRWYRPIYGGQTDFRQEILGLYTGGYIYCIKKYLGYILVGIYTVSRNTWVIYWWVYVQEHEMI